MPVIDGHEVIRTARQLRPGVDIVCMSGYSDSLPPAGVAFLRKPFSLSALCKVLMKGNGVNRKIP